MLINFFFILLHFTVILFKYQNLSEILDAQKELYNADAINQ